MNTTKTQLYRVVGTTTIGFVDPKVTASVKWKGSDTDELSREFPPSNIFGADDLSQKEIEDGFIITRYTFEQQLGDGSWEAIDDPRRRLTPMTDLERAIDAENRRDFPGDYITEDDEGDYDDYRDWSEEEYDEPPDEKPQFNCESCQDYGCKICEPKMVCSSCNNWSFSLEDDGMCPQCSFESKSCTGCYINLANGDDRLCSCCRKLQLQMDREQNPYFGFFWRMAYSLHWKLIRWRYKSS